jgi:CheY-like chemotaxis protein
MGFGSILQKKLPENDPLAHYAEQVLASVERGAELTKSLLAFSRKQVLNPHLVNINDVIRRAAKFLQRIMGEDIKLETRFIVDGLTVNADPGQIEQVLMNLATNARDAMPNGGSFSITTDSIEIDTDFVRSHGFGEPGRYACLTAGDTGYGMETDTASRVFEPFFTTKDIGKGTGLGLSIVYGIVKQHNGYIDVSSEPGKGTSFRIYLKHVKGDLPVAPQWEDLHLLTGGGETILLAEDDGIIRDLVNTLLIESGYTVIDAVDGEDAVRKYLENREAIELVLLDVIMPKKSGKKVLDEIKVFRPDIRAVLISGYPEDGNDIDELLTGGVPLLLKPVTPQLLLKTIRDVLNHGKGET